MVEARWGVIIMTLTALRSSRVKMAKRALELVLLVSAFRMLIPMERSLSYHACFEFMNTYRTLIDM